MDRNPIGGEIPLTEWRPVHPDWQIQMMNWLRVRQGQAPYTMEEIRELKTKLEAADSNRSCTASSDS